MGAFSLGRKAKYAWDKWFQAARQGAVTLTKRKDYDIPQSVFASQIRAAAWRRGLRVKIHDLDRSFLLEIVEDTGKRQLKYLPRKDRGIKSPEITLAPLEGKAAREMVIGQSLLFDPREAS